MVGFPQVALLLNVCFLVEPGLQLKNRAAELHILLFTQVKVPLEVVDDCLKVDSLSFHLIDMDLSFGSHLALQRLDLYLERLNFSHQIVLIFDFNLGVLLEFICQLDKIIVELLSGRLAVSDELLVLSHVSLEVLKDLKLRVEGDQRVELVLQFDFLLLKG